MTEELAKVYEPKSVETAMYAPMDRRGHASTPTPPTGRSTYCIVIPPPNVTAALHLGHALNNTLQDVLVRFRRMQQRNTLWMPGTDHAGIATQTVVEKRILSEESKRRTDFAARGVRRPHPGSGRTSTRPASPTSSRRWAARATGTASGSPWTRSAPRPSASLFFKLFTDGLIYRGKRLVNWDPATQTVLADDEVEHVDIDGTSGICDIRWSSPSTVGGETIDHVTVATTRPETMLGDTAVAMNPRDPRAEALVGRKVRLPIVGREIPIIADEHVVLPDPESDDEKAQLLHRLPEGHARPRPGRLRHRPAAHRRDRAAMQPGEPSTTRRRRSSSSSTSWPPTGPSATSTAGRTPTRPRPRTCSAWTASRPARPIVEFFRSEGLLEEVRDYSHQVGHSYRSHVPIEPYLSDQWYVAVKKEIPNSIPTAGRREHRGLDRREPEARRAA